MVQAEVADRLAAPPGSRTYGVPSAKAAWYASARRTATVGRTVFWPAPNVDSALVRFDRREPPATDASREEVFAVVDAAFAQRRKMLRSALSALAGSADAAVAALEAAGVDPQARGERVDIAAFARIAEHLGHLGPGRRPTWHGGAVTLTPVAPLPEHEVRVRAPGKVNLSLRVGPREDDGYHPLSTVFQAVSVFEEVVATPAEDRTLTVSGPQAELVPTDGTNLALRAAALLAERAGHRRRRPPAPAQGRAGRRGHGRRVRRRRRRRWSPATRCGAPGSAATTCSSSPPSWARTCRSRWPATPRSAPAAATCSRPRSAGASSTGRSPCRTAGCRPPRCTPRSTSCTARRRVPDPEDDVPLMQALRAGDPRALGAALHNDLQLAALELDPGLAEPLAVAQDAGALGVVVSGSGPTVAALGRSRQHALVLAAAFTASGVADRVLTASGPVAGARVVSSTD